MPKIAVEVRIFNYSVPPLYLILCLLTFMLLIACSSGNEKNIGSVDNFDLEHLQYANRIEVVDSNRIVLQKDIDGNWYFGGMEQLDSVRMARLLYEMSQLSPHAIAKYAGAMKREAEYVVFEGPHRLLPDTLYPVTSPQIKYVLCATNRYTSRCTRSEALGHMMFTELPAIIDQR